MCWNALFEKAIPVRIDDHKAFLLPRVIGMRDKPGNVFGAHLNPKQDWAYCVLLSLDLAQSWERNSPISRRMIW